jgi:hypothetical protein
VSEQSKTIGTPSMSDEEFLSHNLLQDFSLSERRAMLVHRFTLSVQQNQEVTVEVTLKSWESGFSQEWRRKKMRRDTQRQMNEIERHKYFLSERYGRDVGWEAAARDWVEKYAGKWREWWEEQPDSCP